MKFVMLAIVLASGVPGEADAQGGSNCVLGGYGTYICTGPSSIYEVPVITGVVPNTGYAPPAVAPFPNGQTLGQQRLQFQPLMQPR